MNKDKIEGSVKKVAGQAQRKMGEIIGNPTQQIKGVKKEIEGSIQKTVGEIKDINKDADKNR